MKDACTLKSSLSKAIFAEFWASSIHDLCTLCMHVAKCHCDVPWHAKALLQGRPLSIPFISLSLFPSYLLSCIIDCSHCTNFICWLWIMNETRSGGAFSPLLVWYPISRLQCCAIRDQAWSSHRVPPSEETLPGMLLCLWEKRHDSVKKKHNQSQLSLFKTKKHASFMTKQQACYKEANMLFT